MMREEFDYYDLLLTNNSLLKYGSDLDLIVYRTSNPGTLEIRERGSVSSPIGFHAFRCADGSVGCEASLTLSSSRLDHKDQFATRSSLAAEIRELIVATLTRDRCHIERHNFDAFTPDLHALEVIAPLSFSTIVRVEFDGPDGGRMEVFARATGPSFSPEVDRMACGRILKGDSDTWERVRVYLPNWRGLEDKIVDLVSDYVNTEFGE